MKFHIYCYTLGKEEVFFNLAEYFGTKVQMLKDRFDKAKLCGFGTSHFVTKSAHDINRDGPVFIFARYMRDRPNCAADIEKKKDVVHIVLTGWKG